MTCRLRAKTGAQHSNCTCDGRAHWCAAAVSRGSGSVRTLLLFCPQQPSDVRPVHKLHPGVAGRQLPRGRLKHVAGAQGACVGLLCCDATQQRPDAGAGVVDDCGAVVVDDVCASVLELLGEAPLKDLVKELQALQTDRRGDQQQQGKLRQLLRQIQFTCGVI